MNVSYALIATFAIGYIIGAIVANILFWRKKPDGVFRVNLADPMDETLKLEVNKSLAEIVKSSYLVFTVAVMKDESREKHRL